MIFSYPLDMFTILPENSTLGEEKDESRPLPEMRLKFSQGIV